jgi:hypothetical protein
VRETSQRRWVEDIKGPILFLARDRLADWHGVEPGDDWPGEIVVPGALGIVDVADGIALMLHDDYAGGYTTWERCEPMTVAGWRDLEVVARDADLEGRSDVATRIRAQQVAVPAGALVTDVACKGDAAVDALAHVPEAAWRRIARTFRVGERGAVLFDGFWPGDEYEETGYAIELAAGDYFVEAVPRFERGEVVARYVRLVASR